MTDPHCDEALCLMALTFATDVGAVTLRRLVARFGSAGAVLGASLSDLMGPGRLPRAAAQQIAGIAGRLDKVKAEAEAMEREGIRLLLLGEAGYPANLASLRDAPPALYVRGTLEPEDERAVAIVGTRQPSPAGAEAARLVAFALADEGITIVSGLAVGIDAGAHRGALEGGRTLAVVGSGLSRVYPSEHRELADAIASQGALLSERPPGAPPRRRHLLARNRLTAGLARCVVVGQVRGPGGSFVTARYALKAGRPVFVMSWPEPEFAAGPQRLVEEGARQIATAQDIADIMAAASLPPPVEQQTLDDAYDES